MGLFSGATWSKGTSFQGTLNFFFCLIPQRQYNHSDHGKANCHTLLIVINTEAYQEDMCGYVSRTVLKFCSLLPFLLVIYRKEIIQDGGGGEEGAHKDVPHRII